MCTQYIWPKEKNITLGNSTKRMVVYACRADHAAVCNKSDL